MAAIASTGDANCAGAKIDFVMLGDNNMMVEKGYISFPYNTSVIWLCATLLCVDVFFIIVFSVHEIYSALNDEGDLPLAIEWNIGADWSYAEGFGYLKILAILTSLILIPRVWKRPVYLTFIAVFLFVLADDALQLHERFGARIAKALDLQPFGGLRSQDPGEVLVWIVAGVPLFGAAVLAIVGSPKEDRRNGMLLIGGLVVLASFAVVADMAHILLARAFRGAHDLLTLIEDGGEQITLSLICGLAILIHGEVRARAQCGAARG